MYERCVAQFPHKPHSWREGVLWLKKKKCAGLTEEGMVELDEILSSIKPHKHFYRVDLEQSDLWTLLFTCVLCGAERPTSRRDYRDMVVK